MLISDYSSAKRVDKILHKINSELESQLWTAGLLVFRNFGFQDFFSKLTGTISRAKMTWMWSDTVFSHLPIETMSEKIFRPSLQVTQNYVLGNLLKGGEVWKGFAPPRDLLRKPSSYLLLWDSCVASLNNNIIGINIKARFPSWFDRLSVLFTPFEKAFDKAGREKAFSELGTRWSLSGENTHLTHCVGSK